MGAGTQACPPSARPAPALNHQAISLAAIQIFVSLIVFSWFVCIVVGELVIVL